MNHDTELRMLSGSRLDVFLDEAEDLLEPRDDAEVAAEISGAELATLLGLQPCRPDSMAALGRLYRLWMRAGKPAVAVRLLDERADAVLAAVPTDERRDARVALTFWRIRGLIDGDDPAALQQALIDAETQFLNMPAEPSMDEDWAHLGGLCEQQGAHALHRRCLGARHRLTIAQPQRARWRAWDDALLAMRTALSYGAEGRADDATMSAVESFRLHASAAPGQDVDHLDWLSLADTLITWAPDCLDEIVANVHRRLPSDMSQPQRFGIGARLARIGARAAASRGDLLLALQHGQHGRVALSEDQDDAFSVLMLDWLMQTGQTLDAARLAFDCVFHDRPASDQAACRVALQQVDIDGDDHPYWALTLAAAAGEASRHWVCAGEPPAAFVARQMARAARIAPGHPALAALQAMQVFAADGDASKALALMETAVKHPEMAGSGNLELLWLCRLRLHGAQRASKMPFIDAPSGGWSYNVGVALEYNLRHRLPDGSDWPEAAMDDLAARYYEAGLARFEAAFRSGHGHFKDADVHCYAMLCNNLGIYHRFRKKDHRAALALHKKGIAASPFAENFAGVMQCHKALDEDASFVAAAERLWHFAAARGYGRHQPLGYIDDVTASLAALDRDAEIAIWLQRADESWNELDTTEKTEQRDTYLGAMAIILYHLSRTQPEDAMLRLESLLPGICTLDWPGYPRVSGGTLERAGQHERAVGLFQRALATGNASDAGVKRQHDLAREGIARCKEKLRGPRPWWRVW